jgi:hypothetical protein
VFQQQAAQRVPRQQFVAGADKDVVRRSDVGEQGGSAVDSVARAALFELEGEKGVRLVSAYLGHYLCGAMAYNDHVPLDAALCIGLEGGLDDR